MICNISCVTEETFAYIAPLCIKGMTCSILIRVAVNFITSFRIRRKYLSCQPEGCFYLTDFLVQINCEVEAFTRILIVIQIRKERTVSREESRIDSGRTGCQKSVGQLIEVVEINIYQLVQQ